MSTKLDTEIENDLWEQYYLNKSSGARDQLIMAYLPIVKVNARKMSSMYKNKADMEDIVNQGILALIDCIDKYDPDRGAQFSTFASIRIRGSIIDYIRKQDWVPRGIRKKSIDIENAFSRLQNELGRDPTDSELASMLHIDENELCKIMGETQRFSVLSFEEFIQENTVSILSEGSSIKTPEQSIQEQEIKEMIASAIDVLSEKERTIISLYYFEELKQKEIAFVLGLTESRISQIHSKALMKLKKKISYYLKE